MPVDEELADDMLVLTTEERVEIAEQIGELHQELDRILIESSENIDPDELNVNVDLDPKTREVIMRATGTSEEEEKSTTEVDGVEHGDATEF